MAIDPSVLLPSVLAIGSAAWEWFGRERQGQSRLLERLDKFCTVGRTRWTMTDTPGAGDAAIL